MDQLLLGTILFTLLVFLFPTFTFYYLLFALVSDIPKSSQVTQENCSDATNHHVDVRYRGCSFGLFQSFSSGCADAAPKGFR